MISYSNPVWDGYCAGPFVLRHNDLYYGYGPGPADETGREFIVLCSPDLVNWTRLGNALNPIETLRGRHHWAPEVAVADSPQGPWTDFGERANVLSGNEQTIGPGHCSIVLAPDNQTLICCYHAWNRERTMRQLCVDPIQWDGDKPRVAPTRSGGRMPVG